MDFWFFRCILGFLLKNVFLCCCSSQAVCRIPGPHPVCWSPRPRPLPFGVGGREPAPRCGYSRLLRPLAYCNSNRSSNGFRLSGRPLVCRELYSAWRVREWDKGERDEALILLDTHATQQAYNTIPTHTIITNICYYTKIYNSTNMYP